MPQRALAPGRNDSFLFALPCPASHKAWLTGPPPSVQGRGGRAAEAFAALWASSPLLSPSLRGRAQPDSEHDNAQRAEMTSATAPVP